MLVLALALALALALVLALKRHPLRFFAFRWQFRPVGGAVSRAEEGGSALRTKVESANAVGYSGA